MKKKNSLTIFLLILILVIAACGPTASTESPADEPAANELPNTKPEEGLRPVETEADDDAARAEAYPAPGAEDSAAAGIVEGTDGEAYPAPETADDSLVRNEDAYPAPDTPALGSDGDTTIGEPMLEGMTLNVMESFPVQVEISLVGMLPDGCTSLGPIDVEQDGDTFDVTVHTSRPADMLCTQVVTNFEESIPLDVEGLAAGTYTVNVNGFTDTFTLDADNE